MDKQFSVKVEESGRKGAGGHDPSVGPVYRNLLAKHCFPPLDDSHLNTTWDVFRYYFISSSKFQTLLPNIVSSITTL